MQALREACAAVSERSEHVRIVPEAIPAYAAALPLADGKRRRPESLTRDEREATAAYWLTLDAINFGSGWFPTLRKRPGLSGYRTIAAAFDEYVAAHGTWSAAELTGLRPAELAAILGQDPAHELMGLYADSLHDLGDAAGGSAVAFATRLGEWASFADCSRYGELRLPFLKRGQITAWDVHRTGVAGFGDLGDLTMFADNLVPHVLRLDGILWFDPDLVARIDREELIPHDSAEEIEIRACAVTAVELLTAAAGEGASTAAAIDQLLWERGGQPRYKNATIHRARFPVF